MRRKISGTAKVKESTTWIYAGHTLKILERRDPTQFEEEYGAQYKLCLKGTEFETRYPKSPYTFIYAHDLEVHEDETQLDDLLIDTVIEEIQKDIASGDVSAIFEMLRFMPLKQLVNYLPEEKWKQFEDLLK